MKFRKIKALILSICLVMAGIGSLESVYADYGDDAYAFMTQLQSDYPYRAVNVDNGMLTGARDWLCSQVNAMGYDYNVQPFTMNTKNGEAVYGENIIFSKQGASDIVIVVGAHYDCVLQTFGTDDNASGVGVLLELANRYSAKDSPYTVRFILFSAEEPGCLGSQYYVENLSQEERDRIACMINVDTIAAGDYTYLYGGGLDDSGSVVRDWAVYQALSDADILGLDMSFHPDVNAEFPVPTKVTASDQMAFNNAGIPYVYCEASNWNGGKYTNFYETANPAVEGGTVMHNPLYDNLTFINETFGSRAYEHQQAYTMLIDYFIENMKEGSYVGEIPFEDASYSARTIDSVYLREQPTAYSQSLRLLDAGTEVNVTGYHSSWCAVTVDGQNGYVKTEYLESIEEVSSEQEEEESSETFSEEGSEESAESEGSSDSEAASEESEDTQTTELVSRDDEQESSHKDSTLSSKESSTAATSSSASTTALAGSSQNASQSNSNNSSADRSILEKIKENPMTLRITLIAAIVIVGIWLCVLIALRQKHRSGGDDSADDIYVPLKKKPDAAERKRLEGSSASDDGKDDDSDDDLEDTDESDDDDSEDIDDADDDDESDSDDELDDSAAFAAPEDEANSIADSKKDLSGKKIKSGRFEIENFDD